MRVIQASFAVLLAIVAMSLFARDNANLDAANLKFALLSKGQSKAGADKTFALNEPLMVSISQNGKAIGGLHPKVWLSLRRSEQVSAETGCEAKIGSFSSGQLATRADVDLNSYFLLTLNLDKTVAFINPQVSWSGSKLEAVVQLPERGLDWALSKDGKWLYVTLPDASAVALIDTLSHRLLTTISTGAGSKPTRIVLAPDQQSVWVGLDGSPTVAVIGRGEKPKVDFVSVGDGLHQIDFTPDSRLAVVTNTAANSLSVIDSAKLQKLADIKVGNTPLEAVWAEKAERFYVAAVNDDAISVVDPFKLNVEAKIEVGRGAVDIAADPLGRYVWMVNQLAAKTYVIDSANNRKVAYANLIAEPNQIAFTTDYAYFRGLASEKFALVNRKQLEKMLDPIEAKRSMALTELSTTQIQAGEKPPATVPEALGVAAMIAPLPDQNGVMIANAPGKTIYYYVEGMMVAMGSLDNYRRIPKALMILNRSLRETTPGIFEAPVSVDKPGNYDVAVMLDQPRIIHCFTARFGGNFTETKQIAASAIKPELLPLKQSPRAKVETVLSIKLNDLASGKPVSGIQDARLLVFEPPGLWQKRLWLQEVSEGVYQASVTFPHAGHFNILAEAMSRGLELTDQSLQVINIQESLSNNQSTKQ